MMDAKLRRIASADKLKNILRYILHIRILDAAIDHEDMEFSAEPQPSLIVGGKKNQTTQGCDEPDTVIDQHR